jgi:V8-like Glu-specific endopeptidase
MSGPTAPVTEVAQKNIYKGVEILHRVYRSFRGDGSDWALVKLDRKVENRAKVVLSGKSTASGQSIYIIGYPCGLPLKYAPGANVSDIKEAYFSAYLDVYCGNSGSPVFNSDTHEVIGIVVRGDNQDFRWTGKGWLSVTYPNPDIDSNEPQCTRVSEFAEYCR